MIQTFQTWPVDEMACVCMRESVASGVCAFLFWKLHTSSTEVFVQRWTGADRRLFESERRGGREREKNTKPIKQWSTVSDVARLLIGERGCAVCESERCGHFNALGDAQRH